MDPAERSDFLKSCLMWGVITVLVVGAIAGMLAIRIVDAGESCAAVRLGTVTETLGPGLHFVTPLVTSIKCYSIRTQIYEASDQPKESKADYTDYTVDANTSDGQQIQITFGIGFHVDPDDTEYVYTHVGTNMREVVERVVKFNGRSVVRQIAQEFAAGRLYTGDILEFQSIIEARLRYLFGPFRVTLDTFALRKITFDTDYIAAIEQQQIARENIETANFQSQSALYEAQRNAELAKGDAQAAIERARGAAESQVIAAKAEAEAIRLRGEALALYPQVLQLNFIEELSTAKWMMIPSEGITPLIPLE